MSMLDRAQLRELHAANLPLHVLEQDYVQALFLAELYREGESLIFKGGTFLKHAHGLDRFSEDLDFTAIGEPDEAGLLSTAASEIERYGIDAELDAIEETDNAVSGRLRYAGPLYDGSDRSRGSIELDISTRDDLVRSPEWRRLFVPYPETRAVTARCVPIEEAFAEKLRALSTRTRGRDLYDCWFLLQQEVGIDPSLFERKMAAVGAAPRVTVSITDVEWDRDLDILVEHPPPYEVAKAAVVEAVAAAGLSVEDRRG